MAADPARIATARNLLRQLGVTIADLQNGPDQRPAMPTVAEYLPRVAAAARPGALCTYGSYWTRMQVVWGMWRLDAVAASDIEALQHQAAAGARTRRNGRGGRHAGEHVIAAARALFNRAIADGFIDPAASPAHRVVRPLRCLRPPANGAGQEHAVGEAARRREPRLRTLVAECVGRVQSARHRPR